MCEEDPLLIQDAMLIQDAILVRMWKAREKGAGVRLSAKEVWLLMSNALGNWSIDESLTAGPKARDE